MSERSKSNRTDILLDRTEHPVGTRLLIGTTATDRSPAEAVILEWSNNTFHVKLHYPISNNTQWVDCENYEPVVITTLPAIVQTGQHLVIPCTDDVHDRVTKMESDITSDRDTHKWSDQYMFEGHYPDGKVCDKCGLSIGVNDKLYNRKCPIR